MTTEPKIDLGLGNIRLDSTSARYETSIGATYGPAEGYLNLREAIAVWEKIHVDEVILTTGASMGLVSTLATLEKPGSILCPRPYYPPYPKIISTLGLDVIYYDLDRTHGWQPNPQQIAQLLRKDTRALLLNFPSNPTGSLPTTELLQEVAIVVRQSNLMVISDEVYADFIYTDEPFPDVRAIFGFGSVVRLRSFSKLFGMPGERLGYVVADPNHLSAICRVHWTLAMSPPASAQLLALKTLRSDPNKRLRELRQDLAENRDQALQILKVCERIRCNLPLAGIFCWIEVRDCPVDSIFLAQSCATRGQVILLSGAAFGLSNPIYLRASFAVPKEEVRQGFEALVSFLEHF